MKRIISFLIFCLFIYIIASIILSAYLLDISATYKINGVKLLGAIIKPDKTILENGFFSHLKYLFYYTSHPIVLFSIKASQVVLLSLISVFSLIIFTMKGKTLDLYGKAKFADLVEIRKNNLVFNMPKSAPNKLFAGKNILIGKFKNQTLALGGQQFVFMSAPTRTGKGVGIVIPVALSYGESMVVLDIKNEIFDITSKFRKASGQKIFLFEPFNPDFRTHRYNPFTYIRRNPNVRVDDIKQIALSLIPNNLKGENFFNERGRDMFVGLTLYLLDRENHAINNNKKFTVTLKALYVLASDIKGEITKHFNDLTKPKILDDGTIFEPSDICRQIIKSVTSSGDNTFKSIHSSFLSGLSSWQSETVSYATSADDFDFRNFRKEKTTLYIGINARDLEKASKLLNLLFSQLINENTGVLPQADKSLKYQCLLLLDEATAPDRINVLAKAVSYMAGYNMRLLMIVQNFSQLREVYGEDQAKNILSNLALKLIYRPDDNESAQDTSKFLGKMTIKETDSWSRTTGDRKVSSTTRLIERELMKPQELLAMKPNEEIITYEKLPNSVFCNKNYYYLSPIFKNILINQSETLSKINKKKKIISLDENLLADAISNNELSIKDDLIREFDMKLKGNQKVIEIIKEEKKMKKVYDYIGRHIALKIAS